jgi:pyruvate/2-oxoglutarate dehydrogenase complex dihydrolipoamide acyltransferase (E2) component
MVDVHIPKMGMSTVDVDITAVHVEPNQHVSAGDLLVEVDSEKVTYEIAAETAGTVVEVLVQVGDIRNVGDVMLRIEPE